MTHKRLRVAIVVLALVLAQLGRGPTARALTLTVNTTSDLSGTGCMVTLQCSLRRAINEANANPGPDIIQFNIPGTDPGCSGGVCTIQPASALPALTDDGTTIDGYTQPGAAPATKTGPATLKIELDGTNAGSADGLTINSADSVIRGLVINRFHYGIVISGSGAMGNAVSGNYVGVDVTGTTDLGNGSYGVVLWSGVQNNTIGGDTAGERNVISGNDMYGIYISNSGTMSNTVSGNYIGTDASGTAALGNTYDGVVISDGSQYNVIGGDTAGERNVISGNGRIGVYIAANDTTDNIVSGNYIGTDASGNADLGNHSDGVYIAYEAANNVIGGSTAGERNVISGNGWGVSIGMTR